MKPQTARNPVIVMMMTVIINSSLTFMGLTLNAYLQVGWLNPTSAQFYGSPEWPGSLGRVRFFKKEWDDVG